MLHWKARPRRTHRFHGQFLPRVGASFPRQNTREAWKRSDLISDNQSRGSLRVLVVDDSPDTVDSARMLLECAGHDVCSAYDAKTAISLAESRIPEVVIFDLAMPGMDGCALIQDLRRIPGMEHSVLICVSGYADADSQGRAMAAGANRFFVKPVEWPELQSELDSFASRRRRGTSTESL